ncbi:MAG TPA: ABC transporter permease [Candidatus Dormibacteraeota bacterium]|nr:ABC transporter permease [Candidatus Dormibacteraeota bacterium]
MHPRIILTIALKDLKDAIRDGRILMALLMPIGLGLVYNVVMPDVQKPTVTVAIASVDATQLPAALRTLAGATVNLRFNMVSTAADVTAQVEAKKADVGLMLPAGFDAAVAAGSAPTLSVVEPPGSSSLGAIYIASALDGALRGMAGQHAPAVISTQRAQPAHDAASVMINLGVRKYMVLGTLIMLIAMIAIYVLPILLTEEFEKKTADALLMVGTQSDVVAAKVAVGLTYLAVSIPLLLGVARMVPANVPLFTGALVLLSVTMIGFGLLLGALVRSVSQLNTWSSIPLLLVLMPVFFVALDLPSWVQTVLGATPGSQAMRLLVDGLTGQAMYGGWVLAFGVLAAWAVAAYAILIRALSRREA